MQSLSAESVLMILSVFWLTKKCCRSARSSSLRVNILSFLAIFYQSNYVKLSDSLIQTDQRGYKQISEDW